MFRFDWLKANSSVVSLVACVDRRYIGSFDVGGTRLTLGCFQAGTEIRNVLLHAPWFPEMNETHSTSAEGVLGATGRSPPDRTSLPLPQGGQRESKE
jgi:hypothetical protein